MHKVAEPSRLRRGSELHARRGLICPPGERHTCFVPNCSLPHPSLHPLPSVGRVKTDGRFLNGMQQLAPKPNSFPPHPTACIEPHELQNRPTKPQFGEHHAASTALFLFAHQRSMTPAWCCWARQGICFPHSTGWLLEHTAVGQCSWQSSPILLQGWGFALGTELLSSTAPQGHCAKRQSHVPMSPVPKLKSLRAGRAMLLPRLI